MPSQKVLAARMDWAASHGGGYFVAEWIGLAIEYDFALEKALIDRCLSGDSLLVECGYGALDWQEGLDFYGKLGYKKYG